jgi:hypothetical protein
MAGPRAQAEEQRRQTAARAHHQTRGRLSANLLFQGARSAVVTAHRRHDRLSRWIVQLQVRVGYYKTLVAVANKHARILWAVRWPRANGSIRPTRLPAPEWRRAREAKAEDAISP